MKKKVLVEEVIMAFQKLLPKKRKNICDIVFAETGKDPNFKYDKHVFENFEVKYEGVSQAR